MLQQAFSWTENNIAEAAEMWRDGYSITQIGEHLSISRSAVSGFMSRHRELFEKRYGLRGHRATRSASKAPKPVAKPKTSIWTPTFVGRAAILWAEGRKNADIAAVLGITRQHFYGYAKDHPDIFPPREKMARKPAVKKMDFQTDSRSSLFDLSVFLIPGTNPVPFIDLQRNQCRFPISCDEPSGPQMPCCGEKTDGRSYCAIHATVAAGQGTQSERDAVRVLRGAA